MSILNILEGAASGLLAAKGEDKIDEWNNEPDHVECIHDDIHHIRLCLSNMARYYSEELNAPVDTLLSIPVTPLFATLHTNGRKHTYLFFGASTAVVLNIPGVGQISVTFPVGWTEVSLSDLTAIWLATGSPVTCLYRTVNQAMGNNLL